MILSHKYINNFDNSTKEAVMHLYGYFGDEINGFDFAKEIQWIVDSKYAEKIMVKVNTYGGDINHAYSVFDAILSCEIPINTMITGVAASAGGWCWLAGNNPLARDYATFLAHNARTSDGEENEVTEKFTNSIKKIIANMCGKPEDEIGRLMALDKFMDVSEMINFGILKPQNVIATTNKPKILANDVKGIYAICNQFLKTEQVPQTQKQVKKMSKVSSMLKLSNEASEEAQSEALSKVLSDKEALETKLTELQNEVVSLQDSLKAYKDAEDAMKETMVSELIENGIKEGKIEDSTKEVWSNLAKVSYEDAKKALNGIANKKPVHVNVFDSKNASTDPRADWTIRDWELKDPNGLLEMSKNDTPRHTRLFNAFYKK